MGEEGRNFNKLLPDHGEARSHQEITFYDLNFRVCASLKSTVITSENTTWDIVEIKKMLKGEFSFLLLKLSHLFSG